MATDLMLDWGTYTQIIGSGDGYTTLSGTTAVISTTIDLETDGYYGAIIVPNVNFDSTPTDHVDVKVYGVTDGTNADNSPIDVWRIDKGTDPCRISRPVDGYPRIMVTMAQSGATDSHDVQCYYKPVRGITS